MAEQFKRRWERAARNLQANGQSPSTRMENDSKTGSQAKVGTWRSDLGGTGIGARISPLFSHRHELGYQ